MAQYALSGLAGGCVYGLVAFGLVLTFQGSRFFNFAHGELFMLGAMFTAVAESSPELGPGAALAIGIASVAAVSYVSERTIFRRFVFSGAPPIHGLIASLGLAALIRGMAVAAWGTQPRSVRGLASSEGVAVMGSVVQAQLLLVVGATALTTILIALVLYRTRYGIAVRATADHREVAETSGIDVRRTVSGAFVLAGALGALAGGLVAPVFKASVTMGDTVLLKAFAAAVVGTLTSAWGALAGGVVLGLGESFGGAAIGGQWADVAAFTVVVVALVLRPTGLAGSRFVGGLDR